MPIASRTSVSWPMNKRPPASIVTSRARGIRDAALAANRYGARRSERGPCSGVEPEVADRVESVMPAQGITPGARVCHDAQTDEHLRVDFVYPDARPRPLALEVTAIVASGDEAGTRASIALSERLRRLPRRRAWAPDTSLLRSIGTSPSLARDSQGHPRRSTHP